MLGGDVGSARHGPRFGVTVMVLTGHRTARRHVAQVAARRDRLRRSATPSDQRTHLALPRAGARPRRRRDRPPAPAPMGGELRRRASACPSSSASRAPVVEYGFWRLRARSARGVRRARRARAAGGDRAARQRLEIAVPGDARGRGADSSCAPMLGAPHRRATAAGASSQRRPPPRCSGDSVVMEGGVEAT